MEISDLDDGARSQYETLRKKHNLQENAPYMRDPVGKIFVSKNRKPCEQLFQRLLITYEGRVAMCCYDWGQLILLDMSAIKHITIEEVTKSYE